MGTETIDAPDMEALIEACVERGWSDGLPVVPPLRHLVEAHVAASGLPAEHLIGEIPPAWGAATVERIAANTVMAGCRPEYVPAVIAALRALLEPKVGLHGFQCTTHVAAPLLIFNGPVRRALGIECGHNCLGQGFRANATIGRAVRLVLTNLGGAHPGGMDKATFGHPGKFTYCLGENEEESPFPPYHVEAGFDANRSAVTVFAAEAPHNINNHASNDPHGLLLTVADTMRTLGSNNMYLASECILVLGVEHARIIAEAGWSRRHVQFFLYEHARRPLKELSIGGMHGADVERNLWARWVDRRNPDELVPVARVPDDIKIFVAGGAGRHSLFIPGWGTRTCTLPFEHSTRGE
jgi:hypothetical protein